MHSDFPGYCVLDRFVFTNRRETVSEVHTSFSSVWNRILQLWSEHEAKQNDVSMSVDLHNAKGETLQVGVAAEGWLLLLNPGVETKVLREQAGDKSDVADRRPTSEKDYVAYLLPERSWINKDWVQTEAYAHDTIKEWLDSGGSKSV